MLAKLLIIPQKPSKLPPFHVQFNPTSYSISKGVAWSPPKGEDAEDSKKIMATNRELNAPELAFGGGNARVLTLNLFFDVTEPVGSAHVADVRLLTAALVALTRIERLGNSQQPPICVLVWGSPAPLKSDFPFTGVVTDLNQEFTLFAPDGRPLRANVRVTFTEYLVAEKDRRETDPEFTTRVVRRGDTLSIIAAEVYDNPALWRVIAAANQLDDPRRLEIGRTLHIPKIT
jgi:hypothetical protein